MVKIGINGFGRIGRCVARVILGSNESSVEIVGINDPTPLGASAHLLKYDSNYGPFPEKVEFDEDASEIRVGDRSIPYYTEYEAQNIPWGKLGAKIVLECSGFYRERKKAEKHLDAGAERVIVSAPGKEMDATFVTGVNCDSFDPGKHVIVSNASCTTNCLAPLAKVLDDEFGIVDGLMTTIHSYTNDQNMLDVVHKDLRRARAGAINMIPTTTGAAKAVGLVMPHLAGKLNGFALRVPTATVSLVDLVVRTQRPLTVESANEAFKKASTSNLKGVLGYTEEPLVSMDFKGDERSSIVDGLSTMVMGEKMVKACSWYDNEWGYSCRMVDLTGKVARLSNL
jgi:glyceraldehyde 3-phosphate dehydrogenase